MYGDNRGNVEKYSSIEDAKQQLKLRALTENQRYKEIYDLEYFNFQNYHLVLDSTFCSPDLLAKIIVEEATKGATQQTKVLMSTKRLGVESQKEYEDTNPYYLEGNVVIQEEKDDYIVISGMDTIKEAAKRGIPFVLVTIA